MQWMVQQCSIDEMTGLVGRWSMARVAVELFNGKDKMMIKRMTN